MLKAVALALGILGLGISPSVGADLGGDVGGFAKVFNNKSKRLKAGVTVSKENCETGVRTACTYVLTDGVSIVAGSAPDKATLSSLLVHLITDNKMVVLRYLAGLKVILSIYAPDADDDEINSVLGTLVTQVGSGSGGDVTLHGVKVELKIMPPFGVVTGIERL